MELDQIELATLEDLPAVRVLRQVCMPHVSIFDLPRVFELADVYDAPLPGRIRLKHEPLDRYVIVKPDPGSEALVTGGVWHLSQGDSDVD